MNSFFRIFSFDHNHKNNWEFLYWYKTCHTFFLCKIKSNNHFWAIKCNISTFVCVFSWYFSLAASYTICFATLVDLHDLVTAYTMSAMHAASAFYSQLATEQPAAQAVRIINKHSKACIKSKAHWLFGYGGGLGGKYNFFLQKSDFRRRVKAALLWFKGDIVLQLYCESVHNMCNLKGDSMSYNKPKRCCQISNY